MSPLLRALAVCAFAVSVPLSVGSSAQAKGPDRVVVSGYGVEGRELGYTERANDIDVGTVMDATEFWLVYGEHDLGRDPGLTAGQLGPRYVLTYGMGEDRIVQHVYPFAEGGAWAHVLEGQAMYGFPARAGWTRGSADLERVFVRLGARVPPPAASDSSAGAAADAGQDAGADATSGSSSGLPAGLLAGAALAGVVALGAGFRAVRHHAGSRRTTASRPV